MIEQRLHSEANSLWEEEGEGGKQNMPIISGGSTEKDTKGEGRTQGDT